MEKEKAKFKLFSSERKLIKIIEEDTQIYNDIFAKISDLYEDILNIDKLIAKINTFYKCFYKQKRTIIIVSFNQ